MLQNVADAASCTVVMISTAASFAAVLHLLLWQSADSVISAFLYECRCHHMPSASVNQCTLSVHMTLWVACISGAQFEVIEAFR